MPFYSYRNGSIRVLEEGSCGVRMCNSFSKASRMNHLLNGSLDNN